MSVTDVAGTIIKIAIFIVKWKADYQDSQNALTTMGPTVDLVKTVVSGLDTTKHVTLESPLRALMDCLNETKDILVANAKKKGKVMQFFFPKNVTEQIYLLEGRIHKLVSILNLAVSTTHLNQSTNSLAIAAKTSALDFIVNDEAKKFWKNNFGETVFSVPSVVLEKALMVAYSDFLDASALCDLRLRLDNLNTGHVSCHRLSDFCGPDSLSRRLQQYTQKKPATNVPPPSPASDRPEDKVYYPLLLWVDDRPENNVTEIQHAKTRGVCIIVLNSTSEAKQWIARHPDSLEIEDPTKVRMITDNAREGADTALDINAGEDMIRFVRGRRSAIPIMVYCGNLDYTKYTANYTECTAANKRQVCLDFINELK